VLLVIGLAAELALHPLMEQADNRIRIEAEQKLEDERTKRVEVEKNLQNFKTLTQLSEEALAGSRPSYTRLTRIVQEKSDLSERAQERITYIQRELAYYEQPPGLVLAPEFSATIDEQKVRLVEFPTEQLFVYLQDESITNISRFSLIKDICQKPIAEVNKHSLEMLRNSQYLPVVAATTTILRRLHNKALPFLDIDGWIAYLERDGQGKGH
jgi:hypothetical protein